MRQLIQSGTLLIFLITALGCGKYSSQISSKESPTKHNEVENSNSNEIEFRDSSITQDEKAAIISSLGPVGRPNLTLSSQNGEEDRSESLKLALGNKPEGLEVTRSIFCRQMDAPIHELQRIHQQNLPKSDLIQVRLDQLRAGNYSCIAVATFVSRENDSAEALARVQALGTPTSSIEISNPLPVTKLPDITGFSVSYDSENHEFILQWDQPNPMPTGDTVSFYYLDFSKAGSEFSEVDSFGVEETRYSYPADPDGAEYSFRLSRIESKDETPLKYSDFEFATGIATDTETLSDGIANVQISSVDSPESILVNHSSSYLAALSEWHGFSVDLVNSGSVSGNVTLSTRLEFVESLASCSNSVSFGFTSTHPGSILAASADRIISLQAGESKKLSSDIFISGRVSPGKYRHIACIDEVNCQSTTVNLYEPIRDFACSELPVPSPTITSQTVVFRSNPLDIEEPVYQDISCLEQINIRASAVEGTNQIRISWEEPTQNLGSAPIKGYGIYKWQEPVGSRLERANRIARQSERELIVDPGFYDVDYYDQAGNTFTYRKTFDVHFEGTGRNRQAVATAVLDRPQRSSCSEPNWFENHKPSYLPGF